MWHCVGIGLTAFSLLLNIAGLAIPYWYYGSVQLNGASITVYFGLWQTCGSSILGSGCTSLPIVGK